MTRMFSAMLLATGLLLAGTAAAQSTTVTFDDGWEGWSGPSGGGGATTIESDGGNPGAHAHTVFNDFGITFRTESNAAFLGDFSGDGSVTIRIDVKVDSIQFEGSEVTRPFLVDFRSHALAQGGYPWTSAWFLFEEIGAGPGWVTYATTFDPASLELPAGWGGYGAEDPVTFEPTLPPGVTFADVMANVDELAFTTLQPGLFFGFTDFDVRIDNIRIDRGADLDTVFADGFELPTQRND
jgi:hypothetical protein